MVHYAVYSLATGRVTHWKLFDSSLATCGTKERRSPWLLVGTDEPTCRKCARYDRYGRLK